MSNEISSIDDLSSEQLAALVDLAEAYQERTSSRRDVLKAAAAGGAAGLLGCAGFKAATDSGQQPTPPPDGDKQGTPTADTGQQGTPTVDGDKQGTPTADTGRQGVGRGATALAAPGNVQAAVDAVASNGSGIVRLDPTQRYEQPSSPWTVKENVILDFNGAFLHGTGDRPKTDIVRIHPGAQVHRPRIDLYDGGDGYTPSNSYRGRVFSLDTRLGRPYFADGTTIRGGNLIAAGDTGTACYIGVNTKEKGSVITHLGLELDIGIPKGSNAEASIGTAVHLDTTGGGDSGWINGVHVHGHWRYPRTGVLQEGDSGKFNQQVLNMFNVQIQAGDKANAFWQIKDPTWARLNRWWGVIWDYPDYGDYAWKIDSQYQDPEKSWRGCKRNAVNTPNFDAEFVRNRSPNDHYLTLTDRFETTVV